MKREVAELIVVTVIEYGQEQSLDQPCVPYNEVSKDRVLGWLLYSIYGLIKTYKMSHNINDGIEGLIIHITGYMSRSSAENIFGEEFCDNLLIEHLNKFSYENNNGAA